MRLDNEYDQDLVCAQLKYNGIVDIGNIRNQGWPFRMYFQQFLNK